MSTISRRDFMKTAGVMTLAVAASAALAGCSTDNAASDAASSAAQKTLDEVNASTTYTNGQSAVFSSYGHKITAQAGIYEFHNDADASKCGALGLVAITIAAGGESTDKNDKNFYLGETKTSFGTLGWEAGKVLDVKVIKTTGTKVDIANAGLVNEEEDIAVFQTVQSGAENTVIKEMFNEIQDIAEDIDDAAKMMNAAIGTLKDQDIDKGGLTYYAVWNATSTKGVYNDASVSIDFYNSNYMTNKAHVKFSLALSATKVNI